MAKTHIKQLALTILGFSTLKAYAKPSCPLLPVNMTNYQVTMYSKSYNEGIKVYDTKSNSVVHGSCGGGGDCKFKFKRCDEKFGEYGEENSDTYVLESGKWSENYIYASSENSNNAIAYYKVDKNNEVDICDFDVGFKWKVFKDDCEGDYYLYSLGYNDWLNASPRGIWTDPRGLMEHKKCEYFEFYADGGCGKARAFKFTEITLISN